MIRDNLIKRIVDNLIMLTGITLVAIIAMLIASTIKPIRPANAETHVIKDPIVFKHLFEGHEYLSIGGNYIIHSESCPCRKDK